MDRQNRVKIAVDLTPLRPGGENGGAKTLVTTLLQEFSTCRANEFDYLLIAESWNYQELKGYESDNIICLLKSEIFSIDNSRVLAKKSTEKLDVSRISSRLKLKLLGMRSISLLKKVGKKLFSKAPLLRTKIKSKFFNLKASAQALNRSSNQTLSKVLPSIGILQEKYGVELLFCPFSAPIFDEPGLPLVAIAYDLQHLELPFFFKDHERLHRTKFLKDLIAKANKVVCISEFTRQSFLTHFHASPQQLTAIPICIHERLQRNSIENIDAILDKLGLKNNNYLFFPANFWPHKNHQLLLAAYSIYRHKNLNHPPLDLVFTGALEEPQLALKEFARSLGCTQNIHFLGFLDEVQLIAVWQGTRGLIFPSLYEGFGIPVLESMWFDKPVACSAIGSLPEVGGDAVIYFDPRKPEDIASAMVQLGYNTDLISTLQSKARARLNHFQKQSMTHQYLDVFVDSLSKNS